MTPPGEAARSVLGGIVLVLSGLGFPLTQTVIARGGRPGAIVAEGVAVGLLVRDAAMVRMGVPARLQPLPRRLLWLELGAAALASTLGLVAVARPGGRVEPTAAGILEGTRRFAVGLLFGLHTYRFWIYLRPGRGLRPAVSDPAASGPGPTATVPGPAVSEPAVAAAR